MTTAFSLSLPTDIPWKRICVTRDMLDRDVCDTRLPPKWQSSIAVFKYVPAEDYQTFPDYTISYLKVTVSLTGYQPIDQEIQGSIDWEGVNVETIEGLTELLSSYNPCHGAIVQVAVGPHRGEDIPLEAYPMFLDFEPKKRELYELATDTSERQSRSLEAINLTKAGGTTQSTEVFDIDMGGSTSFGMQGSYAGTGGGFNIGVSNAGQWGTKSLNTQQSQEVRSTDVGTERRESFSHSTQISQLYHLLDSYHLGTNRAVFFVQPRPHVLEEPSGFVRGPRPVEGIQEFFLVVAAPKDRPDFCVSVRLDTSHLMETDVLEHDVRTEVSELATASARVPTRSDLPDGTTTRRACFIDCWDVTYLCYRTHAVDDKIYSAPAGYLITGHHDLVNDSHHGSTSAVVAPGGRTLTVHAEANGHVCFEHSGVCIDCPDEVDKWAGYARRQVQIDLRSEQPINKVDTRQSMIVTTRGLCCCPTGPAGEDGRVTITRVRDLPAWVGELAPTRAEPTRAEPTRAEPVAGLSGAAMRRQVTGAAPAGAAMADDDCRCPGARATLEMSPRQANRINEFLRQEMIRSFHDPRPDRGRESFLDTDLFASQLASRVVRSRRGREQLSRTLAELTKQQRSPELEAIVRALEEALGRKAEHIVIGDLVRTAGRDLARMADVSPSEIGRLKLALLGVPLRGGQPISGKAPGKAPGKKAE